MDSRSGGRAITRGTIAVALLSALAWGILFFAILDGQIVLAVGMFAWVLYLAIVSWERVHERAAARRLDS
jgi:hypothetical protein